MKCPKCNLHEIAVDCHITVNYDKDNQIIDMGEPSYDDNSYILCTSCGFVGNVHECE